MFTLSLFLGLGLDVIILWQGRWQASTRVAKLLVEIFGVAVLGVLIAGHNAWLAERGVSSFFLTLENLPAGGLADLGTIQLLIMQSVRMALSIALVVTVFELVKQIYGFARQLTDRGEVVSFAPR